jgi:dihydrofolate reductase
MSGDPYSDHINAMEKWVVSTTLTQPEWHNSEVIAGDVAAEIAERKAQDGGDIVQYGFGPVTDLLLAHGLLDELRLWVHPFMLGTGDASDLLFRPERAAQFELADVTRLASGNVVLTYHVA